jgi:adenine-specific DNA-methyltransferase
MAPLVRAECVTSDGRFICRSEKRNHRPYFRLEKDDKRLVEEPCVLLQRTTAKEQARKLVAAEMAARFTGKHGGVTVENHLNMLVPIVKKPSISPRLRHFSIPLPRTGHFGVSGSVVVSAYELDSLLLADLVRNIGVHLPILL